jgi:acetylornithine deacetylase/succinyl-diaminopimelate desuccinylase-like protein
MNSNDLASALTHFDKARSSYLDDLKELVRIPSISFPGFDPAPVRESGVHLPDALASGLTDVRILDPGEGILQFRAWTGAPGKPTILLYAHHDVQPTGRETLWTTPPFEPIDRNGRLYGRGTADDKCGAVMHAAAIRSYLATSGRLPANVKVLIEGEEEIGSINLYKLLEQHRELFVADVVLIADSEHFDSNVPTLTASLRGIVTVNVEVRSLSSSVHSGTWGGPLPDPVLALSKMLATLVDDQGRPAIPGLCKKVHPLSPEEKAALDSLPFRDAQYRKQSTLLESTRIIGGAGSVYEKMWHRPSIAVNAVEGRKRREHYQRRGQARVGIINRSDMDPQETLDLLTRHLRDHAPWG